MSLNHQPGQTRENFEHENGPQVLSDQIMSQIADPSWRGWSWSQTPLGHEIFQQAMDAAAACQVYHPSVGASIKLDDFRQILQRALNCSGPLIQAPSILAHYSCSISGGTLEKLPAVWVAPHAGNSVHLKLILYNYKMDGIPAFFQEQVNVHVFHGTSRVRLTSQRAEDGTACVDVILQSRGAVEDPPAPAPADMSGAAAAQMPLQPGLYGVGVTFAGLASTVVQRFLILDPHDQEVQVLMGRLSDREKGTQCIRMAAMLAHARPRVYSPSVVAFNTDQMIEVTLEILKQARDANLKRVTSLALQALAQPGTIMIFKRLFREHLKPQNHWLWQMAVADRLARQGDALPQDPAGLAPSTPQVSDMQDRSLQDDNADNDTDQSGPKRHRQS